MKCHCGTELIPHPSKPEIGLCPMCAMIGHWYPYPRPSVTVDLAVIARNLPDSEPHILLVERGKDPFKGMLALPGGFLNEDETTHQAARRELLEETGCVVDAEDVEFLKVCDRPDRDPRGRTISIAYIALIPNMMEVEGRDDAAKALWKPLHQATTGLAFDHDEVVMAASYWLYKNTLA